MTIEERLAFETMLKGVTGCEKPFDDVRKEIHDLFNPQDPAAQNVPLSRIRAYIRAQFWYGRRLGHPEMVPGKYNRLGRFRAKERTAYTCRPSKSLLAELEAAMSIEHCVAVESGIFQIEKYKHAEILAVARKVVDASYSVKGANEFWLEVIMPATRQG